MMLIDNTHESLDWKQIATSIDGYQLAQEMGIDLQDWGATQEKEFHKTGTWVLSESELRLMLFYEARADYFSGYTYHERDEIATSLIAALQTLHNSQE